MRLLPEVLVADDEVATCFGLSTILRRLGLTTHVAADGRSAVEICQRRMGSVGLVFMDWSMPLLTGPEACMILLATDPALQCCLMSALDHRAEYPVALSRRIVTLSKPFGLDEFEAILDTMMTAFAIQTNTNVA